MKTRTAYLTFALMLLFLTTATKAVDLPDMNIVEELFGVIQNKSTSIKKNDYLKPLYATALSKTCRLTIQQYGITDIDDSAMRVLNEQ
ncbi:MAG: hypothetical protein JNL74_20365, partial [Fibrobacteres bacterium]|nr:hypothetical protein [Fibrobacterota bacterium]